MFDRAETKLRHIRKVESLVRLIEKEQKRNSDLKTMIEDQRQRISTLSRLLDKALEQPSYRHDPLGQSINKSLNDSLSDISPDLNYRFTVQFVVGIDEDGESCLEITHIDAIPIPHQP